MQLPDLTNENWPLAAVNKYPNMCTTCAACCNVSCSPAGPRPFMLPYRSMQWEGTKRSSRQCFSAVSLYTLRASGIGWILETFDCRICPVFGVQQSDTDGMSWVSHCFIQTRPCPQGLPCAHSSMYQPLVKLSEYVTAFKKLRILLQDMPSFSSAVYST